CESCGTSIIRWISRFSPQYRLSAQPQHGLSPLGRTSHRHKCTSGHKRGGGDLCAPAHQFQCGSFWSSCRGSTRCFPIHSRYGLERVAATRVRSSEHDHVGSCRSDLLANASSTEAPTISNCRPSTRWRHYQWPNAIWTLRQHHDV